LSLIGLPRQREPPANCNSLFGFLLARDPLRQRNGPQRAHPLHQTGCLGWVSISVFHLISLNLVAEK